MRDDHKHLAHYLAKAEDYRQKAKAVHDPGLKSALGFPPPRAAFQNVFISPILM